MSGLVHRAWPVRLALLAPIALVASGLVAIGRASADEAPESVSTSVSNVATGRADAVDASDFPCTSTTVLTDMPGMSKTFSFGGSANRPVLVLFQAEWSNQSPNIAVIRLLIDGVVQPGSGAGLAAHQDDGGNFEQETNGFNFISAPLAPGTHTATIQWASFGTACVNERSLIVLHK